MSPSPFQDIAAGCYPRGSGESPDEEPAGWVSLSAFNIDRDPVTNADFAEFIAAGGYDRRELWTEQGWAFVRDAGIREPNYWRDPVWSGTRAVPVTGVSWWEAMAFAHWRGRTLPTEAQWEAAARGVDGRTYPWGEEDPELELATFAPDSDPPLDRAPTPVDAHPRNISPFGCRDMAGNFAEWCLDNYAVGYDGAGEVDPLVVTAEADEHVVRGGSGLHDEDYLRSSARDHYHPQLRDNLIGFRCASADHSQEGAR